MSLMKFYKAKNTILAKKTEQDYLIAYRSQKMDFSQKGQDNQNQRKT